MQFGTPATFAIECVHEPIHNEGGRVFGRMCLWAGGLLLGDFDEPACMLNVTAGHLEEVLRRLPGLTEPGFDDLSDFELYGLLDRAIYIDDDRSAAEVVADAEKYFKFDFLTNGGESFDRFKSFIVASNGKVRILFSELAAMPVARHVDLTAFVGTVSSFLNWLELEAQSVRGGQA